MLALTVLLCTLLAIFVSAEAYTVEYYNTDGGSKKATETTAEDGSITLKDVGYDTTAEKEFYGWFTIDGTFYKKGETVTFTENTKLYEASAYLITSVDDFDNKYDKIWTMVKLTCDLNFTSKVNFSESGIHFIDLNGYNITFSKKDADAIWIKRGGAKFYNFSDKLSTIDASERTKNYGFFCPERHSYGDGQNLGLTIGKNVKVVTNGPLVRMSNGFFDYNNMDPDGLKCPWVNIYGIVEANTLVRSTNENGQNSFATYQAPITIHDGASVKLSGSSWWIGMNTTVSQEIVAFLNIGNATVITTNPEFQWEHSYQYVKYNVTGGSYSARVPDGFIQENYACVYNSTTGLYDVKIVPCTLEGSNGTHTYKVQEPYNGMATTCVSNGYHYYRCMCGEYYVGEFLAFGHDYASVVIIEPATATRPGVKEVTCQTCQYSYTFEYSFDPRDQVLSIVVSTADGEKEILVKAGDLYDIAVESTLDSFSAKINSVKTVVDPDDSTVTYTIANMVKLVVPSGVNEIASNTFKNSSTLKEVIVNDGANVTFAKSTFNNCPNLELLMIGNCTVVFNSYVIEGNVNNLTIDVSKANATMKEYAFADKGGVKKFLMGSGKAYHFQKEVFRKSGLEEFIVPDYTTEFSAAYATFYQAYSLKYVYIGRGITSLDNVFDQCDYMQKMVLMDVTEITGQYFTCLVNKGEDVLRIYHHADQLNVRQGKFLYQSYGVILYTNALNFTTTPDSVGSSNVTKTVNGVQVTYPAYTIVRGIPHEYKEGGVGATCTAMGSTGYTTDCPCGVVADATYTTYKAVSPNTAVNGTTAIAGEIVAGEITPALGHEFDLEDGATVVGTAPADCVNNATTTYKCARCDETLVVETPDSARGHNVEGVEWQIINNATCAADGLKQRICKDCKSLAESEVIPAFGHQASGEWVTTQEATCVVGATRVQYCKNEGCTFVALSETTQPNGHTPSAEWTIVVPVECNKNGEKENRCSVCRAVIETATIDALGHEFDVSDGAVLSGMEYPNGFNKAGAILTKCARCDETSGAEVAPIFEAKGYSTNPDKNAINGGYSVNTELLALYESYNGAITYGVVIANANSFTGSFFNNGAVNTEKAIQVPITMKSYSNFDLTLSGFGANAETLELVICAYVIDEDGNATFIQAENDYAVAIEIGEQSFTKVTLALVVANAIEQPDATTPPSNDEEN